MFGAESTVSEPTPLMSQLWFLVLISFLLMFAKSVVEAIARGRAVDLLKESKQFGQGAECTLEILRHQHYWTMSDLLKASIKRAKRNVFGGLVPSVISLVAVGAWSAVVYQEWPIQNQIVGKVCLTVLFLTFVLLYPRSQST
eukprot:NODE_1562_length_581_cov_262.194323_g1549_i0.p1 GENE.NODE_1562_length_581_cov_262.194323_g1549_i0~~NODE_1562_length_581_cov_262.194323_g1549_i0.p1  ORF type:complete len:166 (-),score=7.71 NODE_1562_length_581_cov_262.194323_g1549_i0:82-507(-)